MIAETRQHSKSIDDDGVDPLMETDPQAQRDSGPAEPVAPPSEEPTGAALAEPGISTERAAAGGRQGARRSAWRYGLLAAALGLVALIVVRIATGGGGAVQPMGMGGPTPVRAAEVGRGSLDIVSSYSGELVGEVSDIAPRVGGLLQDVPVRIGDRVARGAVLAVVDDVNLRNQLQEAKGQFGVAQANQRKAAAELESVQADHRRAVGLYSEQLLSEQEFERVEAQLATAKASLAAAEAQTEQARARLALLEQQLEDSRVVAPFAGTVAARYLDRGALVQAGTPILRLVEDAPLLVQFRVPERDLEAVRPGASFVLSTQATSDTFRGTVRRVSGEVSRTDRTVTVEGELAEGSDLLKPGMYADVSVRVRALQGALLVPDVALLDRVTMQGEQTTGVFRVGSAPANGESDGQIARWTPVEVAGRSGGLAAVAGEITEGELVLTLGHSELQDGAPIRVVQEERTGTRSAALAGQAAETAP